MDQNYLMNMNGMGPDEYNYLQQCMNGMTPKQTQQFLMFYSGKRKSPQDILLYTLLGFIVIAGVQRFVLNQTVMGILYLLTFGFCFIGTIVDIINHKSLAFEYNQKAAFECAHMVKMSYPDKESSDAKP
jgi:TM2 domain-containing membrane protein YozV